MGPFPVCRTGVDCWRLIPDPLLFCVVLRNNRGIFTTMPGDHLFLPAEVFRSVWGPLPRRSRCAAHPGRRQVRPGTGVPGHRRVRARGRARVYRACLGHRGDAEHHRDRGAALAVPTGQTVLPPFLLLGRGLAWLPTEWLSAGWLPAAMGATASAHHPTPARGRAGTPTARLAYRVPRSSAANARSRTSPAPAGRTRRSPTSRTPARGPSSCAWPVSTACSQVPSRAALARLMSPAASQRCRTSDMNKKQCVLRYHFQAENS